MNRSLYKGYFVHPSLWEKVVLAKEEGSTKQIKTWSRASIITPEMVGLVILVHNGKAHIPVFVKEDMIGHRLGEFAPTRTFKGHSGDKKVKVKK